MTPRAARLALFALVALACGACATPYNPAAPRGRGWSYQRQGALRTHSYSSRDTYGGWAVYRNSFSRYRTHTPGVAPRAFWKTQYATSRGQLFNAHLGRQGEPLEAPQRRAAAAVVEVAPAKVATRRRRRRLRRRR